MKLWKYSGTFLTWTGIIHTIYAFFIGKDALGKMLGDGLVDSVGEDYERGFAFWFLICGIVLILWGQTLQYYIKKEQKPAPAFLGLLHVAFYCGWLYICSGIRFLAFPPAGCYYNLFE